MLEKSLVNARCHKEVKGWYRLPAMLLVLVCLEDDRRQRCIALYALRRAYATIFRVKASLVEIRQVVLDTSGRLRRVVIEIVDMYIPATMRLSVLRGEQVAVGVVLRDLRGEGHHLPSGRVTTHVGVAQIDIITVDGHDAIEVALELALLLALRVAPLAIEYVTLSHLRLHLHELALDEILYLLDRDDLLLDAC